MTRISLRRYYSRHTPPTSGESLKRDRQLEELTVEEIGLYYSRGMGARRIAEIETMSSVPQRIEIAYRAALDVAKLMRGRRRTAEFENLKMAKVGQ